MDDRVAWTHVTIPDRVMKGETVDDWYPLSGKLGDEREGTINLVLSFSVCFLAHPVTLLLSDGREASCFCSALFLNPKAFLIATTVVVVVVVISSLKCVGLS